MGAEHLEFGAAGGVTHLDAGHEPVALGLGERIGAFHLDRILGGDHHERRTKPVRLAVDADLTFLHGLQQRRLGLG
ncbi:hypothetical protein SDC9_189820 [bioreactor metagenome]|uniref:Uncharacterized protein n=1 Tax=bioreactor metagenome TaxID=1076179 RepID=A0A645I1D7_9ZZZZ